MIVLHAAFCDGQMLLWGESPEEPAQAKPKRRTRATARFPFDSGAANLAKATAGIGLPLDPAAGAREHVVWLPSVRTKVFPSSTLVAEVDADPAEAKIMPWKVTAFPLDSGSCHLLLAITGSRRRQASNFLSPGVIIGDDLAYWADALWYTAGLVIRQQFLPDLIAENGHFRALWRPVIVGQDSEKLHLLAGAMPPAARALTQTDEVPPDSSAREVLVEFITENVDALVRSPDDPDRRRPLHTLHDKWIHLLRFGDGRIEPDDPKIQELAGQVHDWRRPVQAAARRALIHTDAGTGNVIVGPDGPRLIDWQCPALGDPAEDLFAFLSPAFQVLYGHEPLTAAERAECLEAYGDREVLARLTALEPALAWRFAAYCAMRRVDLARADPDGSARYARALALSLDQLEALR